MRVAITFVASLASVAASVAVPSFASAQVWREDPCRAERHDAARTGTVGAVAGHQVGAHSVECRAYPAGYRHHDGCHWVSDYYRGRTHSYEVCRSPRGDWRRYGDY